MIPLCWKLWPSGRPGEYQWVLSLPVFVPLLIPCWQLIGQVQPLPGKLVVIEAYSEVPRVAGVFPKVVRADCGVCQQ